MIFVAVGLIGMVWGCLGVGFGFSGWWLWFVADFVVVASVLVLGLRIVWVW